MLSHVRARPYEPFHAYPVHVVYCVCLGGKWGEVAAVSGKGIEKNRDLRFLWTEVKIGPLRSGNMLLAKWFSKFRERSEKPQSESRCPY